MRTLLAGEGKTELGEWAKDAAYRQLPGEKGLLVALLERVLGGPPDVAEAVVWSRIRKYRAGGHASAEERNVLGLALAARRARCRVVVFSRDRDGDKDRQQQIEFGLAKASAEFSDLRFIGGVAVENAEGWILALCGADGESVPSTSTKETLERSFSIVSLEQKVDAVARAELGSVGAPSLRAWLGAARAAFDKDGVEAAPA